jgi:hypothetical protein
MKGCVTSTPVSSSATVTPLPSKPGIPSSARLPLPGAKAGERSSVAPSAAGYAARTG